MFTVGRNGCSTRCPKRSKTPNANPVLHGSNVYLDYWDPTHHYHNDWKALIDRFWRGRQHRRKQRRRRVRRRRAVHRHHQPAGLQPRRLPRLLHRHHALPDRRDVHRPPPAAKRKRLHIKADHLPDRRPDQSPPDAFIEAAQTSQGDEHGLLRPHAPRRRPCASTAAAQSGHCSTFEDHEQKATKTASAATTATSTPAASKAVATETVLYGVIPWTAGGWGDGQLAAEDRDRGSRMPGRRVQRLPTKRNGRKPQDRGRRPNRKNSKN